MAHDNEHFEEPHSNLPEGEEAPPPRVKTMATVRWIILGALTLFAIVMVLNFFGLTPWSRTGDSVTQYHCPMHPTYVSNQMGECPICGMSLVPVGEDGGVSHEKVTQTESSTEISSQYTCPMHPEVVSDSMGRCPKCGMNLETIPEAKPGQYVCPMHPEVVSDTAGRCPKCNMFLEQVPAGSAVFTCPMHPDVVSDTAGSCPKCGMDLVKKEESSALPDSESHSANAHADAASPTVAGLASVTIEPHRLQLIGLRTERAAERVITSALPLTGYVTANEKSVHAISLRAPGWVHGLYVNETGARITKGAPLVKLYSPSIAPAWQEYDIAVENAGQNDTADPLMKAVRSDMVAMARYRLLQFGLSEEDIRSRAFDDFSSTIVLRSPANGTVIEKNVVEGQYVSPDQPLFVIADLSTVWVVADLYESDLTRIKSGTAVSVKLGSLERSEFHGKVSFVSPVVSENTRTAQARIVLENPSGLIRPGMYASITVNDQSHPILAVPSEAILDGGDEQYLFVVHDGNHFEPRHVTVGVRDESHSQILSGLRSGEEVVTSANFLIDSESRLKAAIAGMGKVTETHTAHGK